MNFILNIDNIILDAIYSLKNPFLDFLMPLVTSLGNGGIIWIIICIICLIFRKTRKCGITMAMGLILSLIVCNLILKNAVARIRPFEANGILDLLVEIPKDFSFPSGHSSASFVASTVIFFYYKRSGICALVLAAIIAFSRLYLYVHYPSDVLCGTILGVSLAFISKFSFDKLFEYNKKKKSSKDEYN